MLSKAAQLTVATLVEKCIYIGMTVALARYLSVADYGKLSFALYFGFTIATCAEFAIQTILTRDLIEHPLEHGDRLGMALFARIYPLVGSVAILLLFSLLSSDDDTQIVLLLVVGLGQIGLTFGYIANAVFRALARFDRESIAVYSRSLIYGLCVGIAMLARLPVQSVAIMMLVANLLSMAIALGLAFRLMPPRLRLWPASDIAPMLKRAVPVALSIVLGALFSTISLIVLRLLSRDEELGWYNSAHALIAHLAFLPEVIMAVVFPAMLRALRPRDAETDGQQTLAEVLLIILAIALPIALGVFAIAPQMLQLIYGSPFAPAAPTLRMLAWGIPFSFINFVYLLFFSACDIQHWWLLYVVLALLASLAGYFVLISHFGIVGAATARVVSEGLLCAVATVHVRHWLDLGRLTRGLLRIACALLALGGVLILTYRQPLLVPVLLGGLAYGAAIVALGPWPQSFWIAYIGRARRLLALRSSQ